MLYFHDLSNANQDHWRRCERFAEDVIGNIFQEILDGDWSIEEIVTLPLDNMEFVEFEDREAFLDSGEPLDSTMIPTTDAKQCKADFEYLLRRELRSAMIDYVEEKFYCAERGAELDLIISPGGAENGIEYGPVVIKIISLEEGNVVAYHFESDETSGQWRVGYPEDVSEYWLMRKEVIDAS